jgi:hypothetical protein
MQVEKFLDRIDQEMIDIGPELRMGCDFYASWTKSCCILDFRRLDSKPEADQDVLLRKEEGGGLLWNTRTGAVYKLDNEAYDTLLELENGVRPAVVAKRVGVSQEKITELTKSLQKLGLYGKGS